MFTPFTEHSLFAITSFICWISVFCGHIAVLSQVTILPVHYCYLSLTVGPQVGCPFLWSVHCALGILKAASPCAVMFTGYFLFIFY